jgi:hypothetical protein
VAVGVAEALVDPRRRVVVSLVVVSAAAGGETHEEHRGSCFKELP